MSVHYKNYIEFIFGLGRPSTIVNVILWLVPLITVISVFVPFSPSMPAAGLDPSYRFGMNQAVALSFSFGKEIILTFGPYASIYTKTYHPATDFMMVGGSLYLALSYWACFALLMKDVKWRWVLAYCAILAGVMYLRDPLLFSLPLLVGLSSLKFKVSEQGVLGKSKYAPIYMALMFSPLGLLPLIKGTMLILCAVIAVMCSVFFIVIKQKVFAIICLISPILSMLLFWIASGQSVTSLPHYIINMFPVASGYTEAMSVDGPIREEILYMISSIFILYAIFAQTKIISTSKILLFCIYSAFLFVSFKAGFVRQDGHATISGTGILIAAILLPFIFSSRLIPSVIVVSLLTWSNIDSNYIKTSTEGIGTNLNSTYSLAWNGIENRVTNKGWPKLDFDAAVKSLREQASFPVLQGKTDIYSFNQSYLIASGNTWSPRPVFQSYSAYTPALAEINREHLAGNQAPENIIFRVEPIDGRFPSIEDGASWPILISHYKPTHMANDYLFLRKNEGVDENLAPIRLSSERHTFGEVVNLPQSGQKLFTQIEIEPTFMGRIANFFFKPSQLQIKVELKNGAIKQYRIIAGMTKSGFLISPLIENTAEFGMLYAQVGALDGKLVKSFAIAPLHGNSQLWNDRYTVSISQI